ncbi:MAG: SusD/RagB family nutrient-binding outer membrane lipoprotein [Draconibacterium sp.]|nr:SusD/RagB family nutrient-binding outer membrane lipoprotein [Draconibacterium sp.]
MKKILIIILTIALIPIINSCSDFEEINESPNNVSSISPNFLLTTNTTNLASIYSNFGHFNSRIATLLQFYQVGDGYKSEQYNALYWTPNSSSIWGGIYNSLVDVKAMSDLSVEEGNVFIEAVALVYKAVFMDLVTKVYGDAPFSETNQLDEGIVFPKYDQQKEIFETILIDLKTAKNMIEGISGSEVPVLDGYDLLYDGDKSEWIKFINSLRIRMCLLLNNKKGELSVDIDAEFRDAAQNVFTSSADNAVLNYIGTSGSNSYQLGPLNSSEVSYAKRMGLGFLNSLRQQNDPRMYRWLRPVENKWDMDISTETTVQFTDPLGQTFPVDMLPYPEGYDDLDTNMYIGLPVGNKDSWGGYNAGPNATGVEPKNSPYLSRLSDIYFQDANEYVVMNIITYSEVEFILAEAAAIGAFGVNDAETHYKNAIESSMDEWGIFDDYVGGFDFDEFYSQESVDLSQATNEHERIMTQKYISMWLRTEPWFDWRRTGYPNFEVPYDSDQPALPIRFHYDTPNPPDPAYVARYNEAVDRLEKTQYVQIQSKDDHRSRMWLLQGTDKPY